MILALLLDLANIAGGFLLAIALLRRIPRVGDDLARFADRVAPFGWIVGIVALAMGVTYLLIHVLTGPHLFIFEIVGIGVGLALLWDRLTGRRSLTAAPHSPPGPPHSSPPPTSGTAGPTGVALLLAVFGVIAIIVGIQGLFTPD
ncbi:hypothetical protein Dvina_39590 [Dactylosporangium vinaceum]|uniref:Integral membrane protein n=1 Tax=Dactylosporangium vinaceum TaxID=53362 RepID=A0ABV5M8F3_9ACTN|nr:hypothetical protein [Dactylosporangium vinaceum]UAB94219.1 hypothetical protein Dvina_39590 [Dactylosporangium vinaceum]